jgi:DNA-binding winged helix-turn-helix (wHTH) protein/tetratricopeptide (TPR) repeat protein
MISFGNFSVDSKARELLRRGRKVQLSLQAYSLLSALIESPGEVVSRETIRRKIWTENTFVDFESGINKTASELRAVLGDRVKKPKFIETVSKRGYRFIASLNSSTTPAHKSLHIGSIIVFPLENLTGTEDKRFLVEGVAEVLTTRLGSVAGLRVISNFASSQSSTLRDISAASRLALARSKGADAALEGSVMCSGVTVRITVRLSVVSTGKVIWQNQFDREMANLLAVYDEVAEALTTEISDASEQQQHLQLSSRHPVVDPEAHMALLRGKYLWNRRTAHDIYGSIGEFEKALVIYPEFALAHAAIANAYAMLGILGIEPSHAAFVRARRAAGLAIELDPALAEAHTCRAEVLKDYDWDWESAELCYQRALELNPNYSTAHHWYAHLLTILGRFEEAAFHMELARDLDPLSSAINSFLPYVYLAARDYDRALREARAAIKLEPYSPLAHWELGRACLFSGLVKNALEEFELASKLADGLSMWEAERCFALGYTGDRTGAESVMAELLSKTRSDYLSPYDLALCMTGLGRHEASLDYLNQAYRERVMRLCCLGDPEFDSLRSEPRYVELVRKLRLPLRAASR